MSAMRRFMRRGGGGGGGGGGGAERRLNLDLNLLREIVCSEFPKSLEGKIRGNRGKTKLSISRGNRHIKPFVI
jgi:hypothetical protein